MSDSITATKRCTKCGNEYPATTDYFYSRSDMKDALRAACIRCTNRKSREWNVKNKDKIREISKKYHAKYPERVKATQKAWNDKNPDRLKASYQRYRERYPDKVRANSINWAKNNPNKSRKINERFRNNHREENRQKSQEWRKTHKTQQRIQYHIKRARKKSLPFSFTEKDWRYALEYWHNCCAYCGRPRGLWHTLAQDHFIPQVKGGGYTPNNILPACHGIDGCNNQKADRDAHEWLVRKFGKHRAKRIEQAIEDYFDSL